MTNAAKLAGYVGAALTADGTAGILTAITYIGDGSSLTGIADTANIVTEGLSCSGVITATGGVVGNVPLETPKLDLKLCLAMNTHPPQLLFPH